MPGRRRCGPGGKFASGGQRAGALCNPVIVGVAEELQRCVWTRWRKKLISRCAGKKRRAGDGAVADALPAWQNLVMGKIAFLIVLLFGASTNAQAARSMCQIRNQTTGQISRALRETPHVRRWPEHAGISTYYRSSDQTLWWVTGRSHPAYPAILCRTAMQPVEAKCGNDQRACRKLVTEMSKAKF